MKLQPIDNKRDTFRNYIEEGGLIEYMTKILTELYTCNERPKEPMEFFRERIGVSLKEQRQIDFLKEEIENYRQQIEDLKKQLEEQNQQKASNVAFELPITIVEPVVSTIQLDDEFEPAVSADVDNLKLRENVVNETFTTDDVNVTSSSVDKIEEPIVLTKENIAVVPPPVPELEVHQQNDVSLLKKEDDVVLSFTNVDTTTTIKTDQLNIESKKVDVVQVTAPVVVVESKDSQPAEAGIKNVPTSTTA